MSIFRRDPEPETPEVEVHGEDVVIKSDDHDTPDRRVKMPKTKFA